MAEFLTFAAQEMLIKVASVTAQEFNLVWGFKGELTKLRESLVILDAMLQDAEHPKQNQGKAVKLWLEKLEDIAHHADDVLDDYGYELLRRKVELQNQIKKKVQHFFSLSNPIVFRVKITHKIKKMNAYLESLNKMASNMGLVANMRSLEATTSHDISDRETDSGFKKDENNIVGRDGVVSDIVKALTNSNNNRENDLSVLAIVGMGGLGKTTLAKSVCLELLIPKEPPSLLLPRSDKAAKIVENLPRFDLRKLSDHECWLILKDKAVPVGSTPIPEDQENIGREIAKKCGGVPLMAKVLGGMMRSKNRNGWQSIVESDIWDLPDGEKRILSILKLSFDDLRSPSLKQCFAYCSNFIKDFEFGKDDLIQLWMAQGWLHSSSDKNDVEMEVRGNEYFYILLEKSFFQDVTTDGRGNIIYCKMHDLVHDLAESVSKSKNLRSLFSKGEALGSTLPRFKALRVLNLYEADIQELPISLGKLKHLRYLNVMKTGVKAIPKSIGQLYHLQTLKMPYHLDEFPKEIANLINLRHVYYGKHVKVPIGILGRLTNLRSLPFFKVGEEAAGPGIEELGSLNQLKDTLSIYGLENVRDGEEAQKANLAEKKHVRNLVLRWKFSRPSNNVDNEEDVLEGLRPHSNLEFLEIEGFMGVKFPSWLFLSNNLKEIELFECNKCEGVPILGHLPNLVHVKMMRMENLKCLGSEFYGYDHVSYAKAALFPALKKLRIEEARNLTEWMEAPTDRLRVFPCLEKLSLIRCDKLTSAPSHFPSLKKLRIECMDSWIPIASIVSSQLTTLIHLDIEGINGFTSLPEGMLNANKNLAHLNISGCSELTCIASQELVVESLQLLRIWGCPKLRYLPDGLLHSLEYMTIGDCESLESIPFPENGGLPSLRTLDIGKCPQLSSLPEGLQYCTSLQYLTIEGCSKITCIPITSKGLPSLRQLVVTDCPELSSLPSGLGYCTSLQELSIQKCQKVSSISIDSLISLRSLTIGNVECLSTLPVGFTSLRELTIGGCKSTSPQFELQFCASLQLLVSLQDLSITNCPNLETIPSLDKLTSLDRLEISECSGLKCLPSGVASSSHCLSRLKTLIIGPFWAELDSFPTIQVIPQLESLSLNGWPKLKSLPEQIQHFTSLTDLDVRSFDGLEAVPEWLGNLASLEYLWIGDCKNVMYLPSVEAMHRLTKLNRLRISGCPLLKEKCAEESGPEWPKIYHIPNLYRLVRRESESIKKCPPIAKGINSSLLIEICK
ncbi:hypothetical protein M0R45_029043 [Rubus argutus]|uniref:Uncharacterized protein n=1 Tax=Rubus argutus TaxID=59490 RepID=A0AAW1W9K5_RUBAR